jgi:hypothetical protein
MLKPTVRHVIQAQQELTQKQREVTDSAAKNVQAMHDFILEQRESLERQAHQQTIFIQEQHDQMAAMIEVVMHDRRATEFSTRVGVSVALILLIIAGSLTGTQENIYGLLGLAAVVMSLSTGCSRAVYKYLPWWKMPPIPKTRLMQVSTLTPGTSVKTIASGPSHPSETKQPN